MMNKLKTFLRSTQPLQLTFPHSWKVLFNKSHRWTCGAPRNPLNYSCRHALLHTQTQHSGSVVGVVIDG